MGVKAPKRLQQAETSYDRTKQYSASEAIELVKRNATAKFDETVEVSLRLGIDPRKQDQLVRGSVSLPAGTGKDVRVAVFATGDKARDAQEAGADVVGEDDLIQRISDGWLEFDASIATPDLMPKVARVGKILGPRGLMPNPKTGTVTPDVAKAVREFKAGKVEYRNDKFGNVHLGVGKSSFESQALLRNLAAVLEEIIRAKPAAAKGKYIQSITVTSTMGPGVKVDPNVMPRDIVESQ